MLRYKEFHLREGCKIRMKYEKYYEPTAFEATFVR